MKISGNVGFPIKAIPFKIGGNFIQLKDKLEACKDLNEQLNVLNVEIQNQTKFEFDGLKIIPKSIEVAKIQLSKFKSSLKFERIKHVYTEGTYNDKFSLSTNHHKNFISKC